MADQLTQLQVCLDQLITQMYASLRYIDANAPVMAIEGQAYNVGTTIADDADDDPDNIVAPDRAEQLTTIAPVLHELSSDIMFKYSQIQELLDTLPGVGVTEQEQRERIAELDEKVQMAEQEREQSLKMWDELMSRVDTVVRLGDRPQ